MYFQGQFQYAICIDFVTTCWDHRNFSQADAIDRQEIIEFPAVLLNLQSHVIEADFHTFVRPTEEPKLSEFCKDYTGISQDDVNNAPLLQEAIRKFHQWIESFRFEKGIVLMDDATRKQNTVFITWTDFDLGIYLPTECGRKNVKYPSYFNKWIDLREYYSLWTGIDRVISFQFALKMIGLQFFGRPHSGEDDARNLARLVCKMSRAGIELLINSDEFKISS
ncbi:ERI1 exoribonuclease 2-like [Contarinia nasturtii]|uniref:ERI1 exoribonuclease 2-like n=1 Tax=Contarinia nasturtii TaxID=265458 RepID=UPI0012D46567|nr:ERI1 exoribonuclease 2-like [Contarinia nasturtii]